MPRHFFQGFSEPAAGRRRLGASAAACRLAACIVAFCASAALIARAEAKPEIVRIQAEEVELTAALYKPSGPGPHPAVIALHGCGGLFNAQGTPSARHDAWGEKLAEAGFVVLMPDSFKSRGLGSQCGFVSRAIRASRERVADMLAAKIWLQARPEVKRTAISLVGWSHGGSTVLAAIRQDRRPADDAPDIARAVAFYPGCRAQIESPGFRARLPLLILMGDADDWTPAAPCKALVSAAADRGEPVQIKLYADAYHDFDHPNRPLTQRAGAATAPTGTATVGTNASARQDALWRVPAFLAR